MAYGGKRPEPCFWGWRWLCKGRTRTRFPVAVLLSSSRVPEFFRLCCTGCVLRWSDSPIPSPQRARDGLATLQHSVSRWCSFWHFSTCSSGLGSRPNTSISFLLPPRFLFPSQIQPFAHVLLLGSRSKCKAAGAEEPRSALEARFLSRRLSWKRWCNPAIAQRARATWLDLVPCCPISRQRQETKARRLASHLAAPPTAIHKIWESGEDRRVSDTCRQGIQWRRTPRVWPSREPLRRGRLWVNKQIKSCLGKRLPQAALDGKNQFQENYL